MLGLRLGVQSGMAGAGSAVSIPSFSRDFVTVKNLNHGIGPDITYTRTGGSASYFDSSGVMQFVSAGTGAEYARFDHDPSTLASRGLLIEEGRTNSLRNSQAGGSTNGVIGSGGVMPTNWTAGAGASSNGVSTQILGTGTANGFAYIDLKISGTPTSNSVAGFNFETTTQVVAANGQTWTNSGYFELTAGALTNATLRIGIDGRTAAGAAVSGQATSTTFTATGSAASTQRKSHTTTFSDATVERVLPSFQVSYTSGNAIDFTLRIAAPQLEQGAFATSYIPTTSAAVTRGADVATVTPISSFVTQTGDESLFAEFSAYTFGVTGGFPRIVQLDQGSTGNANRYSVTLVQSTSNVFVTYSNNNVGEFGGNSSPAYSLNSIGKTASGIAFNNARHAFNGSLIGTDDTSITLRTTQNTHLQIGNNAGTSIFLNGHIRKIAYYPKRLSNERLRSLTV